MSGFGWLKRAIKAAQWKNLRQRADQIDFLILAVQCGVISTSGNVHLTLARMQTVLLTRAAQLGMLHRLNAYRQSPLFLDADRLLSRDEPTLEG